MQCASGDFPGYTGCQYSSPRVVTDSLTFFAREGEMIYHWRDMIYGKMYDIISVPIIREAYIICEADIIASAISSVTAGNGYH